MQPGDALGGLTQALGQPFGDMEVHRRGSSWAAEPSQEVPRAGWARATGAPGGSWRKISGGHPGLRSPGRGCLGRVGRGPRGPLEGHGGKFQGVIPGCGAQAGGASGGSGEGPGGPWRVMEDDFRGSSRAAEPRQGVPRAGRARAPGAPGGSWRTISGGHPGLRSPGRGCLGRVGRGPRGPLEGHGGRFQGVIPGCGAQAGGASGGGPGGPWRVMEDDFRGSCGDAQARQGVPRAGWARAPGAPGGSWRKISGGHAGTPRPAGGCLGRVGRGPRGRPGGECFSQGTRGTSLPWLEYQGHESAFAGVPGPRVCLCRSTRTTRCEKMTKCFSRGRKPSFRKQRPPERRSGRTPDALPGSRGAPNGPFHRCQLALFLRFSRLLSFMRRRVKHHLTDRLAHQTRHRRAPAGRPSAGVRAGGSSGPRVGLYVREGPAQGVRESPRLPPRVPPGPTDRKRDRDAPSAPAVLPRSPWRGRGSPAARCQGRPSAARRGPSGKHSVSRTLGSVAPTPQTSLGGRSALPSGVRPPSAQSQARRVRPGSPPLSGGLPDNLEPIAGPRGGDVSFECLPYQLSMVLSVPTMVTTGNGESGIHWRASLVPAAAVIPAPIAYLKVAAVKKLVVGSRDRADGPPRGELPSVPAPASRRPLDALS
ncbi:hypothetical protein Q8A73_023938 [Channa argus]|nr:hypothetical protein Q8A73_023938 [Channa argus]